ncbi:hypothetical protein [Burkholderia sp. Ac-20344]|uniref:hypothetical protein n=1 Tax=Burkholderia sp. Ac-20344 TaxID=2703890 RepID=UPI00197C473E|nr:hypothetical protein [Burkholderia sp. Ac-20344]MBN3836735.1 hypothetical protein [Burkholderia sp. Ac-20344]
MNGSPLPEAAPNPERNAGPAPSSFRPNQYEVGVRYATDVFRSKKAPVRVRWSETGRTGRHDLTHGAPRSVWLATTTNF